MNNYEEIVKELKARGAKGTINKGTKLSEVGIDSLDLMDMVIILEGRLSIRVPDDKLMEIVTLNDLLKIIDDLTK